MRSPRNPRARRPVISVRVSPDVYEALQSRVMTDLTLSHLAERYLVAGLQAEGVNVKQVKAEARLARKLAAEVMQEVGRAVKETIDALLEKYGAS